MWVRGEKEVVEVGESGGGKEEKSRASSTAPQLERCGASPRAPRKVSSPW